MLKPTISVCDHDIKAFDIDLGGWDAGAGALGSLVSLVDI
jgi:hypothetical protein